MYIVSQKARQRKLTVSDDFRRRAFRVRVYPISSTSLPLANIADPDFVCETWETPSPLRGERGVVSLGESLPSLTDTLPADGGGFVWDSQ